MKKFVVTGGCGFIGSNLVKFLLKKNYFVINIDKLSYSANPYNLKRIFKNKNYRFFKQDINNQAQIYKILNRYKPNGIFNLAAETHVDRSIDNPRNFIKSNILGVYNLLQALNKYLKRNKKKIKLIHVSTDEVYGSLGDSGKFLETTPYDPSSPYSASKAGSDHLVRAWHRTFDLPILITNCSNNYGPHQFPEKLIPLMIINCLHGKPLPVYGKGENVRDWLFVRDHCEAILTVLRKGKVGETYNIGGNNEIKNIDVIQIVCDILDEILPRDNGLGYSELIHYVTDRPGHDFRYAIDSTKIEKELGWLPIESFETGVRKTIQWYLDNRSWWKSIEDNTYRQERLGVIQS